MNKTTAMIIPDNPNALAAYERKTVIILFYQGYICRDAEKTPGVPYIDTGGVGVCITGAKIPVIGCAACGEISDVYRSSNTGSIRGYKIDIDLAFKRIYCQQE